ncbi:MAG TPA: methylated-DNA--[protein]-cysteine S-methyltransferase [Aldersonia sp.]
MRPAAYATVATPIGPFTTVVDHDHDDAVLAAGWTADLGHLLPVIHPALRPVEVRPRRELGAVTDAVIAYHRGETSAIDTIRVRQRSGEFIEHAWRILRAVPAGAPVTYREFAARAGRPAAVRAAANACGRNAAALFVPCHRVVRVGGGLGGFRWGVDVKDWLLAHER